MVGEPCIGRWVGLSEPVVSQSFLRHSKIVQVLLVGVGGSV